MGCIASCRGDCSRSCLEVDSYNVSSSHSNARTTLVPNNCGKHASEGYSFDNSLVGKGSYGTVRLCTSKASGSTCAMKMLRKDQTKEEHMNNEIDIQLRLDHPNIVKLLDVYEDPVYVYIVMEYCVGGQLLEELHRNKIFFQDAAVDCCVQILRAIRYMHVKDIAHRDVKPENVLLKENRVGDADPCFKLIDFGLARAYSPPDGTMQTRVGSAYYIAPEIILGAPYRETVDVWSCGVVFFMLLGGYPPFDGNTDKEILRSAVESPLLFSRPSWKRVTDETKKCIAGMCERVVAKRKTAEEALEATLAIPHINQNKFDHAASAEIGTTDFFAGSSVFAVSDLLRRRVLHLVAHRINDDVLESLKDAFIALDEDMDGMLDLKEFRAACVAAGLVTNVGDADEELNCLFELVDTNKSAKIDWTEFIAAAIAKKIEFKTELCWDAFRVMDTNNDGVLTCDELYSALLKTDDAVHTAMEEWHVAEIIKEADVNKDGVIDFAEFVAHLAKTNAMRYNSMNLPKCKTGKRLPPIGSLTGL